MEIFFLMEIFLNVKTVLETWQFFPNLSENSIPIKFSTFLIEVYMCKNSQDNFQIMIW